MSPRRILDQHELYFITITTVGWIDVFTRKNHKNIVLESLRYCQREKGLLLFAYVIMSNHIHLIVRAGKNIGLSPIVRDFKKYTANTILKALKEAKYESRRAWMKYLFEEYGKTRLNRKKYQFWQDGCYPIALYSPNVIEQKLNYIHLNPVRAGIVDVPEHYIYSSASNYYCGKGLIEVEIIEPNNNIGFILL